MTRSHVIFILGSALIGLAIPSVSVGMFFIGVALGGFFALLMKGACND